MLPDDLGGVEFEFVAQAQVARDILGCPPYQNLISQG